MHKLLRFQIFKNGWYGLFTLALWLVAGTGQAAQTLDVYAIPSKPIVQLVSDTSKQLATYGMQSFYQQGRPVHITLYLTTFPDDSDAAIKQAVQQLSQQYQPIPLIAKGFTVTKGNWAFIDVERSRELQRLADKVTLALEPLRDPHPVLPEWVKAYPGKLAAFERYGSPNVFQNFEPHLTLLAAEKNPQLVKFQQLMQQQIPRANGEIIGLGIGVTDEWGQQRQVLAEYFFKP
ncbi:2'-5' RNA ligase family protein [Shewanella sp. 4t3-1-2LB]|uniref:2'-5' RNA ligase family protein n=1 Tax=Shewanella sp. 4t3-1-2LB TaxID=2817682 RepID=UPI001A97E826|nr:2'-5' RNA ligase family protein [Shewanella sp. 4t3-1-2LB]MBO1271715.1 2'-5' RNA ligase family protein [Shewanella sp. 4t3-1-2LB]